MTAGQGADLGRAIARRFVVLGAVGGVGLGLAIGHASSGDWYWLNVSALGADSGSDLYFNLTMFVLGLTFLWAVVPLRILLATIAATGLAGPRWVGWYRSWLVVIGIALSLTGVFTIGGARISHAIHDGAGFTAPLLVMAMMLTVHWALPPAGRKVEIGALVAIVVIVAMFVLSVTGSMSYALMEILSFFVCGVWLYALARRLAGAVERAGIPLAIAPG